MKKILLLITFATACFLIYWFVYKKENPQRYADHLTAYRHERAEFYRNSPQSPFIKQKINFTYLDYYTLNIGLRIEAKFEKNKNYDTLNLATSTGTIEKYIKVGQAKFNVNKNNHSLLVLRSANRADNSHFIPFIDKTSGGKTYGGGRYLDVELSKNHKILLDFNKSYNPYCAYTDVYTCPLPPKENRLTIAIEAGEKSYQAH